MVGKLRSNPLIDRLKTRKPIPKNNIGKVLLILLSCILFFLVSGSIAVGASDTATNSVTTAIQEQNASGDEPPVRATDSHEDNVTFNAHLGTQETNPPIVIEISNSRDEPLRNVEVSVGNGENVLTRTASTDIPEQEDYETQVPVSGVENELLTVRIEYETENGSKVQERTVDYRSIPTEIRLTGVSTDEGDGHKRITGSVSNLGISDANSVLVRVQETEDVTPVQPQKSYFVGTVLQSNFAPFEVTAAIDDDADTIPLEVTYIADGERHTKTTTVEVSDGSSSAVNGQVLDSPLAYILGGLISVGIVGITGYAVYNGRRS